MRSIHADLCLLGRFISRAGHDARCVIHVPCRVFKAVDDGADCIFEFIGKLAAKSIFFFLVSPTQFLLFGLKAFHALRVGLENGDRAGHFADFVLLILCRDFGVEFAASDLVHGHGHGPDRMRDRPVDAKGDQKCDQKGHDTYTQ